MTSSTLEHPSRDKLDASTKPPQERFPSAPSSTATELASLKIGLQQAIRQFPDFPTPGILFEDILPLFADPHLHRSLIRALELHVRSHYRDNQRADIVVGLEARGFLLGPSLALALGAGFVPIRKKGKLPGPTETAGFEKEYGKDWFEVQQDAIKQGQHVLIVDDLIATGGSAAAAGTLVKALGGTLLGYVFLLELNFLKGREKLDAPVFTLLSRQEGDSSTR
ncbi:adenine phosphoribosyltransferase [Lobaria immixta]|nr:adenine phosphoribosyltransferase [Lobaria immixta]